MSEGKGDPIDAARNAAATQILRACTGLVEGGYGSACILSALAQVAGTCAAIGHRTGSLTGSAEETLRQLDNMARLAFFAAVATGPTADEGHA